VKKLKPSRIIDLATLTGAVEIALGEDIIGFLSNNDVLSDLLVRAGSETGERVWRLPLHEDYRDSLKSDVADMKNSGGRSGSCIKAALFLQEFVDQIPWAHLDIAGTAFLSESKQYRSKHATASGVRLIVSFLELL
jgi:leucyl aminopeptidase